MCTTSLGGMNLAVCLILMWIQGIMLGFFLQPISRLISSLLPKQKIWNIKWFFHTDIHHPHESTTPLSFSNESKESVIQGPLSSTPNNNMADTDCISSHFFGTVRVSSSSEPPTPPSRTKSLSLLTGSYQNVCQITRESRGWEAGWPRPQPGPGAQGSIVDQRHW